jgi:hypothetical protein
MRSEKQIAVLEERKREARDNIEKALICLTRLSEQKQNDFVSNTEIACSLFPRDTYEEKFSKEGTVYKQNSKSSTVLVWLRKLVNEGKVETKLKNGKRIYKPI